MNQHSSASNKKKRLSILLIDDEKAILHLNRLILESDFDIYSAINIAEALEVLSTKEIHIIIADHHIAKENGLHFLISLKQSHPEIVKVLFTSCISQDVMIESHNSQEIFRYLTKPCTNEQLLENANLAQIAWEVLRLERSIRLEHKGMKKLIGETTQLKFKIENITHSCIQLYCTISQNITYLVMAVLFCGIALIVFLYSLKSILGIDVFN